MNTGSVIETPEVRGKPSIWVPGELLQTSGLVD